MTKEFSDGMALGAFLAIAVSHAWRKWKEWRRSESLRQQRAWDAIFREYDFFHFPGEWRD